MKQNPPTYFGYIHSLSEITRVLLEKDLRSFGKFRTLRVFWMKTKLFTTIAFELQSHLVISEGLKGFDESFSWGGL